MRQFISWAVTLIAFVCFAGRSHPLATMYVICCGTLPALRAWCLMTGQTSAVRPLAIAQAYAFAPLVPWMTADTSLLIFLTGWQGICATLAIELLGAN